jgi:hypothetical protein
MPSPGVIPRLDGVVAATAARPAEGRRRWAKHFYDACGCRHVGIECGTRLGAFRRPCVV